MNRYHAKRTFDLTVQTRLWLCWGAGQRGKQEVANSSSTGTRRLRPAGTASASEGGGSWTRGRMSEHGRFGLQHSDQLTKVRFRDRFVSMASFIFNFTVSFSKASYSERRTDWTFQDLKKSIPRANRFLKHIFSNAKQLMIDFFSFSLIIWF